MKLALTEKSALIIVDVQYDFLPGGSLGVPNGDVIIEPLNRYIKIFKEKNQPIFATRDWHPPKHISFKEQGGIWPPHCIQNTQGAMISKKLKLPNSTIIVNKAYYEDRDAYSGFQETILDGELRRLGISRVFIGGLATDYCVKATVLDALNLGYETILLLDGIKGVNLNPEDSDIAIEKMLLKGAIGITIQDLYI